MTTATQHDEAVERTTDPMERLIEAALLKAGIRYETETENAANLDFHLPDHGVHIEVKRFHSDRIGAQMARADNVIAAQGKPAVEFLAGLLMGERL